MKEFFENLKEIREKKGLSLEDIARRTRLPLQHLRNIEAGELEKLPQGYDRIFFKRYLKEIGEDKEDVWRDFNLFFGTGPLEEEKKPFSSNIPEEAEETEDGPSETPEANEKTSFFQELSLKFNMDRLYLYFWVTVSVVVLAVVGYFAYQQFMFVQNNSLQVKEISLADQIEELQKKDSLLTPQMSRNTMVGNQASGTVSVELHALERTWIREIRDLQDTTDYIMVPGLVRKIEAQSSVQLMLGRADGVEIKLNGDNLGVMGTADQIVLRLSLTQEGITEKRLKTVARKDTAVQSPAAAAPDSAAADTVGE